MSYTIQTIYFMIADGTYYPTHYPTQNPPHTTISPHDTNQICSCRLLFSIPMTTYPLPSKSWHSEFHTVVQGLVSSTFYMLITFCTFPKYIICFTFIKNIIWFSYFTTNAIMVQCYIAFFVPSLYIDVTPCLVWKLSAVHASLMLFFAFWCFENQKMSPVITSLTILTYINR